MFHVNLPGCNVSDQSLTAIWFRFLGTPDNDLRFESPAAHVYPLHVSLASAPLLAVVAKVRQWMEQEKSAVLQKDGQLQAASRVTLNLLPFLVRKANAESSKMQFFPTGMHHFKSRFRGLMYPSSKPTWLENHSCFFGDSYRKITSSKPVVFSMVILVVFVGPLSCLRVG